MKGRFQFSLLSALAMMLVAAVVLGAYVWWWPCYRAGKVLDDIDDENLFSQYPLARRSLVNDESFQSATGNEALYPFRIEMNGRGSGSWINVESKDYSHVWTYFISYNEPSLAGKVVHHSSSFEEK